MMKTTMTYSDYEARTLEEIKAEGYPPIREDELRILDRQRRDEIAMREAGLYGECTIV